MTQAVPAAPLGHAGTLSVEFAIRRVLLDGLVLLANDPFKLDQVFERLDAGASEEWEADHREVFLEMCRDEQLDLRVKLAFPVTADPLPMFSVTSDGGGEDESGAMIGDVRGAGWRPTGEETVNAEGDTESPLTREYRSRGIGYSSRVDVGCWSTSIAQAHLLLAVARLVLVERRPLLTAHGIHRVRISDTALRPDASLNPRVTVVPILQLGVDWTLRVTERGPPRPSMVRFVVGSFRGGA